MTALDVRYTMNEAAHCPFSFGRLHPEAGQGHAMNPQRYVHDKTSISSLGQA